jgi:hypothetical protein
MSRVHWLAAAAAVLGLTLAVADDKKADTKKTIDDDGFIKEWLLLAPIPLADGESQADAVDKEKVKDEAKLAPKDGDKVKVGKDELTWKKQTAEEYYFNFNTHCGEVKEQAAGYAVTYITADAEVKDVTLKIGSDDGWKVWLNGTEVGKGTDDRPLDKDQNSYEKLTLKKGENVLVFKVCNGIADWTGCARFVDKDDKPVTGLKVELKK